jgi:hypothetical protein
MRMNMKPLILAGCSVIVLGAGTAWAGPCDMGRTTKDAGSGPASQSSSQTTGMSTDAKPHPPTETMNRASGDVATSSEDTQRQMQGQPTAAQLAEGAKPGRPTNSREAERQMHAQPSVAEQPKGEGQTQPAASEQSQKMTAGTTEQTKPAPNEQSEKMTAGSAQPAPSEKKTAGTAEQGC